MAQITLNSTGVASSGTLALQSNGTTTAVTIDASQNVGVGVTPSAWGGGKNIQLAASSSVVGSNDEVYLAANSYFNGTNNKYIANGFATQYSQETGVHKWFIAPTGTAGNNITFTRGMTLNANGVLALQGAVTNANGVGITFPTTAISHSSSNANTLDDYEEGTWTPVFNVGAISGTSISYSGTYTKIGRVVTVNFYAYSASNNINVSSYVIFSGMPFSAPNLSSGSITSEDIDIFASLGFANVAGTNIGLSKCGNATSSYLHATVTYFV